ncbi:MAG: hypothetical protein WCS87_14815 [Methylococcaceae bacterium]
MTKIHQNLVSSRTTIAITIEAVEKLRVVIKDSGVKLYEAMDAMIDLCEQDSDVRERIIDIARVKKQTRKDGRTQSLATRAKNLPKPLQDKLREMTDKQLAELIEKAGM